MSDEVTEGVWTGSRENVLFWLMHHVTADVTAGQLREAVEYLEAEAVAPWREFAEHVFAWAGRSTTHEPPYDFDGVATEARALLAPEGSEP